MRSFRTAAKARDHLLIFARVPLQGETKSRLAATIGEERSLEVYRAMLHDVLRRIGPSGDDMQVTVVWTSDAEASREELLAAFGEHELSRQTGGDLGERMLVAMAERAAFHRASKIIVVGTDHPELERRSLQCAFSLLDGCDWVIGPASDGGYYLIGCRAASFQPDVFRDVPWSSRDVLGITKEKLTQKNVTAAFLPTRSDIDVESDLRSFAPNAPPNGEVARVLRDWGWL